jgi:hypothetical protein
MPRAKQLTGMARGQLEWRDLAHPSSAAVAMMRSSGPLAVARCEIDPMLINAGPTAPDGFAVGHETVAEVIAVGPGVSSGYPRLPAAVVPPADRA